MNWLRNRNKITGKVLAGMVRRIEKAYEILELNATEPVIIQPKQSELVFEVQSTTDRNVRYQVDADTKTCTCPDFNFRYVKCKHILAAEFALGTVE
ncbi:MAG: SWIM zinc finger family protein [Nitrososphaera sp.]|jgi:hypothetical protein